MLTEYQQRKIERIRKFESTRGIKWVTCAACSGSGFYDSFGSPPCGGCGGLRKVPGKPREVVVTYEKGRYKVTLVPNDEPRQITLEELTERHRQRKHLRAKMRRTA